MTRDIYVEIIRVRSEGHFAVLATIIARKGATPRKDSAKMLVYEDGSQLGSIGGGSLEAAVCREAQSILKTGKPKLITFDLTGFDPEESALVCGGSMDVYLEPISPETTIIIFGAGHVGKAVAEAGKLAGFKIAIVDDRAKYANPERFPCADAIYAEDWETALAKLNPNHYSYFFVATRDHQFDLICLRFAVQSQTRYIGMLGSRKKAKILCDLLEKEGVEPSKFAQIFVPAGLDIGAETPEEIAASVMAEMIAVQKKLDLRAIRDAVRRVNNPD
jgi:xanthine dehydrogenase accessory factor